VIQNERMLNKVARLKGRVWPDDNAGRGPPASAFADWLWLIPKSVRR
jgi:hypothetical protein